MNPLNSLKAVRRRRRQQQMQNAAIANSFVTDTVMVVAVFDDKPQTHRRTNRPRQRELRGQNLIEDYFIEHFIYDEQDLCRRFRMSKRLFNCILTALCNHNTFWHQKQDCTGLPGLLTHQKVTAALRMLAYSACADQCDEITRMRVSTTLECIKKFCSQVYTIFGAHYPRTPAVADITRLLRMTNQRGFLGMIGSIDCMHWKWKNCSTAWQEAYSGRKGRPIIILEAVALYGTWIWYSFFGVPGAQNDVNVMHQSDVFDALLTGRSPQVAFKVNGMTYHNTYNLADGIYSSYSSFVKTILNPRDPQQKLFSKKQEAYHKDIERCFAILQSHWEEFEEDDFVETNDEDIQNPTSIFTIYDGPVDDQSNRIHLEQVGRDQKPQRFADALIDLESAYLHGELQKDLLKHNWLREMGEQT